MQSNGVKVIVAGVAGTLVMTGVGLYLAPMMGIPRMNPAEMLAGPMGGSIVLGWLGHLMIGVTLAVGYSVLFAGRLPGPPALRGAMFSLAPWLMAQVVVVPMMGMPLFSGSASMAIGSLVGHLVYGMVIGAMIGRPGEARRLVRA